jgi:hypothetical protein
MTETTDETRPDPLRHARRLDADARHPALVAEEAIRWAIDAANAGDATTVREEVEFAKYVLITRRCGMANDRMDVLSAMRAPGLALCSGLSDVSELAQRGITAGQTVVLAEAAMRARAIADHVQS